ncbi:MAG TPA: hypothetical protein VF499_09475 [Afipia sp.]
MSTAAARRLPDPATETTRAEKVPHDVARLRPGELRRLFRRRHGKTYPFDDEGLRDRTIMLDHIAQSGAADAYQQAVTFLDHHCHWTPPAERSAVIERSFQRRKFWDKSELGNALGLTWDERGDCAITTFRPAGATDADMIAHKNMREAARKREKRRQETLHPEKKQPLPVVRALAIAGMLRPGERCAVSAICKELKRKRQIPFAHLQGKALATAVHNAIDHGIERGFFRKDVDRTGRIPVASVTKIGEAR